MQNRTLISASFVLSLAASVLGAVPAFAASPGNYDVMIMTHLCKSSIRTAADFNAMENGKTPIHVLGDDVVVAVADVDADEFKPANDEVGDASSDDAAV
jgi:homoaconitase/3-isopropylmalate dehydratase large subunit